MAEKVKVRFDPEGDFLEVQFVDAPGYMYLGAAAFGTRTFA